MIGEKKEEKDTSNENGIKDKTKKENIAKENIGQKREATTKDAQKVNEKKDSVKVGGEIKPQPQKVVKQHSPGQKYRKEWNVHDTL